PVALPAGPDLAAWARTSSAASGSWWARRWPSGRSTSRRPPCTSSPAADRTDPIPGRAQRPAGGGVRGRRSAAGVPPATGPALGGGELVDLDEAHVLHALHDELGHALAPADRVVRLRIGVHQQDDQLPPVAAV